MARHVRARETRVRTTRTPDGLQIDLRRIRPAWRLIGLLWTAAALSLGVVLMVTGEPPENSGGNWFIVLWIAIGCAATALLSWGAFHRERLLVGPRTLIRQRWLGPIRRGEAYDRSQIKDLRVEAERMSAIEPRVGWRSYGLGTGSVAFDYGDRTVRVAEVDDAEAKRVVAALAGEGLPAPP